MNAKDDTTVSFQEFLTQQGFVHIYTWHDAPGVAYPLHAHKGRVTLCIVEGSVTFSGGFEKTLVKGGTFDVPVGVEHTAVVGPDGCTYVVGEEIEGDS
jgi:quercetin dioxygenase-like cupin family protein